MSVTCSEPHDDTSYLAWLECYPDGYVINAEPGGRGYVKLHRAVRRTIRNRPPVHWPFVHQGLYFIA